MYFGIILFKKEDKKYPYFKPYKNSEVFDSPIYISSRKDLTTCESPDCWRRWLAASNNQPSRKGQRLTMSCWKILITNIEDIEKEIDGMKNKYDITTKIHLGSNTFVKTPYRCVNLRKFRDGTIPTQEGLSLKFGVAAYD